MAWGRRKRRCADAAKRRLRQKRPNRAFPVSRLRGIVAFYSMNQPWLATMD